MLKQTLLKIKIAWRREEVRNIILIPTTISPFNSPPPTPLATAQRGFEVQASNQKGNKMTHEKELRFLEIALGKICPAQKPSPEKDAPKAQSTEKGVKS